MDYGAKQVHKLAYQFAKAHGCAGFFNRDTREAGAHWLKSFMTRNRLSLRAPEQTSAARARGFNWVSVQRFYDILGELMDKYKYTADRMYNVDETGITTVAKKPSRILAVKGRRQVGILTSAERGWSQVTVEVCMSAVAGHYIPPLFVFPRVRMKPELTDNAPSRVGLQNRTKLAGCTRISSRSGFRHFLMHRESYRCTTRPAHFLTGHKTHTSNLDVI